VYRINAVTAAIAAMTSRHRPNMRLFNVTSDFLLSFLRLGTANDAEM
jgi:hypothetical protein